MNQKEIQTEVYNEIESNNKIKELKFYTLQRNTHSILNWKWTKIRFWFKELKWLESNWRDWEIEIELEDEIPEKWEQGWQWSDGIIRKKQEIEDQTLTGNLIEQTGMNLLMSACFLLFSYSLCRL